MVISRSCVARLRALDCPGQGVVSDLLQTIPDHKWGEAICAVVVLRDGQTATEEEFIAWRRPRIAGYKRPRSVAFIRDDAMPRTTTGKVLHRVLRERYSPSLASV